MRPPLYPWRCRATGGDVTVDWVRYGTYYRDTEGKFWDALRREYPHVSPLDWELSVEREVQGPYPMRV